MKSNITRSIAFKHEPLTVVLSNRKPDNARQFKPGKWGCVMFMLTTAVKAQTAVFERKMFGCQGGGNGLGFENQYKIFPGGEDCFSYLLPWETGRHHISGQ